MMGLCLRLSLLLTSIFLWSAPQAMAWDDRPSELYTLCKSCHGQDGTGNQGVGAPAIAGLPEWYLKAQLDKFSQGLRGAHAKDLRGMRMRPIGRTLTEENRASVAKYVSSLPRPKVADTIQGNLAKGEATFGVCTACHGADALGNQAVNAPPTAGNNDWYLLTQLKNFKNKVRGYDPTKDPNGAAMAGIATTLDDQAMINVVAYINALKPAK